MLKDIENYIAFDVTSYIKQIKPIVPTKRTFSFQQILEYVMLGIFVRMTGCLEHKFDMVSLQLSMDDEQWRQKMMRNQSKIPSSSKDVNQVIVALIQYITDNFDTNYNCEIWADKSRLEKSTQTICTVLEEIDIMDYMGTSYIVLKKGVSELPEKLPVKSNSGKTKNDDFIKIVYDQTIRFRNVYAHNEESVYAEFNRPQKLDNEIARYNNWCFRFTVITYSDELIRNLFKDYMEYRAKALLI